ncbi:MAG TPA: hypothetical protein VKP66_03640 [Steroidobacteraceae bacterium]|nr:hypothetical protein [Steroidobacteraceae bacterium]
MKLRLPWSRIWLLLLFFALADSRALAATVNHIQVRVVTGANELTAGSVLELRIYEAGRPTARHLPLTHGEAWPRDSTRIIPLALAEPLDPRAVLRFGLFYRAASPLTPAWEVASAEVDLPTGGAAPERLLNATLTGIIERQGELATEEREPGAIACLSDADCDDHRSCNGRERCAPREAGADARGCVKGAPVVCPVNQVCTEEHGCRGIETAVPATPAAPADGAASRRP